MRAYLTLHEPARSRDWYARGLWGNDTLYTLIADMSRCVVTFSAARDGIAPLTWRRLQSLGRRYR